MRGSHQHRYSPPPQPGGYYHQDERDEATGRGCVLILLTVLVAVLLAVAVAVRA